MLKNKKIREIFREREIEYEEEFGRKRSKIFGGKPSSKADRRLTKQELRNIRSIDDIQED